MESSQEFIIIRAFAMLMSWGLMGVAAFVVVWWPVMSIMGIIDGEKFSKQDEFIFATAIIGFSAFCLSALRLPFHYYFGVGDVENIARWSREVLPYLQIIVFIQIFGYALHVHFAWNRLTRVFLVLGLVAWAALGGMVATGMGAFNVDYVWKFSDTRLQPVECAAVP